MTLQSSALTNALGTRRSPIGLATVTAAWQPVTGFLQTWLAPVLDLAIRLWIAKVFFLSGLTKIRDWQSTLFLFEYEYQVPVLPTALAAALGTATELVMPVLLAVGLFSRLAAVPLLVLSMVIQFVVGAGNPAYSHIEHYYWMFLLGIIILHGPGTLSLDHLLGRLVRK